MIFETHKLQPRLCAHTWQIAYKSQDLMTEESYGKILPQHTQKQLAWGQQVKTW
jgi:hypothetical protein